MPASIASSRCWAMSGVKIGVSASSPIDDAGVAGGDRPAAVDRLRRPPGSAVSVSAERTSARPTPTRICGGMVRTISALGSSARPPSPPATRIAPAAARALRARHRGAEAGGREGAASGITETTIAAPIGRQPPALDQEQDEQEERRGDRRRDQSPARGWRAGAAGRSGAARLATIPVAASWRATARIGTAATIATGTWIRKIDCQETSSVSTPPTAGPSAAPVAPAAAQTHRRPALGADGRGQQLEHRGDRQGTAQRLHAAGGDQGAELGREAAGEAGAGEDRQPDRRRRAPARPGGRGGRPARRRAPSPG